MGFSETAPLEYAEFVLARETGWNLDEIAAHRVDEALVFMGLEARYRKFEAEKAKGPKN